MSNPNSSHSLLVNETMDIFTGLSPTAEIMFLSIIMITALLGNFFNLWTIYLTPSLRTYSNVLLSAIAINDFLTSLFVIPFLIAMVCIGNHNSLCQLQGFLISIFNGASFMLSVAISVERCHAVVAPFTYIRQTSARNYALGVVTCYIGPLILAIMPLLSLENRGFGRYYHLTTCWLPFHVNSRNDAINTAYAIGVSITVAVIISCNLIQFVIAYNKAFKDRNRYQSILIPLRTISLIVGTNVLCWLPFNVLLLNGVIRYWCNESDHTVNKSLAQIALILTYCNIAINPIIFVATNSELRKNLPLPVCTYYNRDKVVPFVRTRILFNV
ncbi:uncharacterized protein TRIADDRAFT_61932 [Trichoplax adhaerens]|uniref:G-protein coupled receptors family 1 profile domain-containing protein n=1 Tax=Trichoplax adhaerens TaxID=10228 RepID=B3SCD1_TRIAD|nr:hypothetical protein TRIADDRAFT_61932 [Trichoplax adhaerens]EDV19603.1 hypothetical protein TRIADDRAFT_61932 [Trichoplax adhaerens]|eukprot:XP_002117936.1 hypothetical protein TRIADDRAFT_61932 [Trichoplax adhaerens]